MIQTGKAGASVGTSASSLGLSFLLSASLLLKTSISLNSLLSYDSSPAARMIVSFKFIFGGRFLFLRSLLRDFAVGEGPAFLAGSNVVLGFSSSCCFSSRGALVVSAVVCGEGVCSEAVEISA